MTAVPVTRKYSFSEEDESTASENSDMYIEEEEDDPESQKTVAWDGEHKKTAELELTDEFEIRYNTNFRFSDNDDDFDNYKARENHATITINANQDGYTPDPIIIAESKQFHNGTSDISTIITGVMAFFNFVMWIAYTFQFANVASNTDDNRLRAARYLGIVAVVDAFFTIFTALRNPLLERYVTHRSHLQNLRNHIALGVMTVISSVLHGVYMIGYGELSFTGNLKDATISHTSNTSGLIDWCVTFLIAMTTIPAYRRLCCSYFVFWCNHSLWVLLWIIFAMIHTYVALGVLMLPLLCWVADYAYFRQRQCYKECKIVKLSSYSNNVVGITFVYPTKTVDTSIEGSNAQNRFEYLAGQFIYVNFPDLTGFGNKYVWRPLYLSSAPYQNHLSVHCAITDTENSKSWSNALLGMVVRSRKKNAAALTPPRMNLEGPFGQLTLSRGRLSNYTHVVFITGGRGVTYSQAMLNDYLFHSQEQPDVDAIRRVHFVWTTQENEDVCFKYGFYGGGKRAKGRHHPATANKDQIRYLHFQPFLLDHARIENNAAKLKFDFHITQTDQLRNERFLKNLLPEPNPKLPLKPDYIHIRTRERPDVYEIIVQMVERAARIQASAIAVVVCGPQELREECENACKTASLINHVAIDTHFQLY